MNHSELLGLLFDYWLTNPRKVNGVDSATFKEMPNLKVGGGMPSWHEEVSWTR